MFYRVPVCALRILIFSCSFLIAPCAFAQYSSLPPGEDHPVLGSKLQKELGKALEALRANKPADARGHLDTVYRDAPGDADTNFLFGVYSSQTNDWVRAKNYWERVLSLSPNHLGALLSLGSVLMRESKPNDAAQYFHRAIDAEPTSWRAYAVLADAYLRQGMLDECIRQAERALELGHGQAIVVQPLARALELRGDKERAALVLQSYLQENPEDRAAVGLLKNLQGSSESAGETSSDTPAASPSAEPVISMGVLLASNWLPPDVDEKMPPVEASVPCNLNEVLENAGKRIKEFVANVDRFAATESVTINRSTNGDSLRAH